MRTRRERLVDAAVMAAVVGTVFGTATVVAGTGVGAALQLGQGNTVTRTTSLSGGVNGPALAIGNPNASPSAAGLSINVATGKAPIKVNSTAGKATNLNADRLDGLEGAALAKGKGVTVLANRLVLGHSRDSAVLLRLPGLGVLEATCFAAPTDHTMVSWRNTTSRHIDLWFDNGPSAERKPELAPPGHVVVVAYNQNGGLQHHRTVLLGWGHQSGPQTTAAIELGAFRLNKDYPCGVQATATIWSKP